MLIGGAVGTVDIPVRQMPVTPVNCIFIQIAPLLGYNKYHFVFIK